ncbi:hypothetical protein ACHAWO_005532 [Cyclotella atomus]|uniref:Uncharacterized protein n=1 Tax=Cyclotella atomus TaxID=382360 RepID=A0ABD3NY00_9STRA
MNSTYHKNAAVPSWDIPHVRGISSRPIEKLVSKSSFTYYDSNRMSLRSEPTKQELEEMKRMVKKMINMPASAIFEKFGLNKGNMK